MDRSGLEKDALQSRGCLVPWGPKYIQNAGFWWHHDANKKKKTRWIIPLVKQNVKHKLVLKCIWNISTVFGIHFFSQFWRHSRQKRETHRYPKRFWARFEGEHCRNELCHLASDAWPMRATCGLVVATLLLRSLFLDSLGSIMIKSGVQSLQQQLWFTWFTTMLDAWPPPFHTAP